MATLAELRAALRVLLNDNAAEGYLWSDAALNLQLNDALRGYGRSLPQQRETTIATVAGQGEYDLPADCLAVVGAEVEGPAGRWPLLPDDGSAGAGSPAGAGSYELYGGRLILRPAPSETGLSLQVRYLAPHAILVFDGDPSTVPTADEDLLLAFACAGALQALSTEEAKRRRFEDRSGQPVEGAVALYRQQYERGIRARTAGVRTRRLVIL